MVAPSLTDGGLAAAFAGGTLESFAAGTMEWRFEVGVASREGILAAFIARNGGKTAPTAVEGNAGFLRAFADRVDMAERIPAQLGKNWEIMHAGFKPYPVCAANQSPIMSMIDLAKEKGLEAENIHRIRIRVKPSEYRYPGLNFRGPFRTVGATLMSTPFCLALACVEKDVTLQGLGQLTNPEILALIELIEHIPDEQIPALSCVIEVETKTGKTFVKKMMTSPDYYNFELPQVVKTVNKATSETGVNPLRVREFIELVNNVQDARSIQALVESLSPCP